MIGETLLSFILIAALAALGLWALSQFPTLDATIVKIIRIVVYVVLTVMLLNVLVVVLFHRTIWQALGTT